MVSFVVASLSFPLWLRASHYINALFIGLMIRSGIQILAAHLSGCTRQESKDTRISRRRSRSVFSMKACLWM